MAEFIDVAEMLDLAGVRADDASNEQVEGSGDASACGLVDASEEVEDSGSAMTPRQMLQALPRRPKPCMRRRIAGFNRVRMKIKQHWKQERAKALFYNKHGFAKTQDFALQPANGAQPSTSTRVKAGRSGWKRWDANASLKIASQEGTTLADLDLMIANFQGLQL